MSNRKHRLGDLCTVKHGFAFPGEFFSSDPEYPVLVTPGNFAIGGGFQQTKVKTFSGDFSNEWVFRPGDLVVTMTDLSKAGDTLGFPARIPRGGAFLHNQRVGKVVITRPEELDIRYLEWVMCAPPYRKWILGTATGSAVKHTSPGRILDFEFVLPDLEHQKRVASILDSLSEMIAADKWVSDTLESIAQALFRSWFVDFDPVQAKKRGENPVGMDDATAALFPESMEESELGGIPAGWITGTLGDFIDPKKGKGITKSRINPGSVPVVAGGLEPAYFHDTANAESPVVTVSASGANAGFVRLYLEEIWASDCSFINQDISPHPLFWYLFLKANQERIFHMQQGAAQPHIYPSDLKRLPIPYPTEATVLPLFEDRVSPLFEMKAKLNAQSRSLTEIRDSLLPRLISGELQLPEDLVA